MSSSQQCPECGATSPVFMKNHCGGCPAYTGIMKELGTLANPSTFGKPAFGLEPFATAEAASGAVVTAATATEDQLRRTQLLADVELHLKSCRIFLTSREKMHPCGVDLHDELLVKVSTAIEQEGRNG